mgnify:CR=1 FL=1
MAKYTPPTRFNVPAELLNPTYDECLGVATPTYPKSGPIVFVSFRSFGGTETEVNGVYGVEDTATVETWCNPDIHADSRLLIGGNTYELRQTPENIDLYGQYMRFKVRRIAGKGVSVDGKQVQS